MTLPKLPLWQRISGPNAVPISQLVARGEAKVETVRNEAQGFLRQRLAELKNLQPELFPPTEDDSAWRRFYVITHDIRGSAVTAGQMNLGAVCASLEGVLSERDRTDARISPVIASHLDAVNLILSGALSDGSAVNGLMGELSRVVRHLPLKK